jgi:hypothetical protein
MIEVFVGWDEDAGRMRFSWSAFEGATRLSAEPPEGLPPCALIGRFGDAGREEPGGVRGWLSSDEAARGAEEALRLTDSDDWFVATLREAESPNPSAE